MNVNVNVNSMSFGEGGCRAELQKADGRCAPTGSSASIPSASLLPCRCARLIPTTRVSTD